MITADELQAMLDAATPGPWKVDMPYTCDVVGGGIEICSTHPGALPQGVKPAGVIPQHNARLIALAPDLARKVIAAEKLADALKVMVQEAVELAESGDAGFWDPEAVESVIASRAALAAWEATQ